ncbi:MAG TPA: hypothetical protein GXZ70_07800, partial [Clostridiales bacterium]|nr:hypothetical protein [Clostridiales bacterium]
MSTSIREEKKAVECGYWHLYRYDPRLNEIGKNPFQLDSKEPNLPYREFLDGEIRYAQLNNTFPDQAEKLFERSEQHAKHRFAVYKSMSKSHQDSESH